MSSVLKKIVFSLPLLLGSATLFWLSSQPDLTPPDLGFNFQDKLYHAAAYFVYGASALMFVMVWYPTSSTTVWRISAWTVSALFALSDELHQYYVPTRHASIGDWIADAIGASLSLFLVLHFRKYLFKVR